MSVEDFLKYAFDRFDVDDYEGALKGFMAAHHASEDLKQKEDIFGVIYENYIRPNEDEFKAAYENAIRRLKEQNELHIDNLPEYESLPLMMIPVSDKTFYVWDKDHNNFWGSDPLELGRCGSTPEDVFSPLLIDGFDDMRLIVPELRSRKYSRIYFVYRNHQKMNRFLSFLMIPDIGNLTDEKRMDIFDNADELKLFLLETGAYIPRQIKCVDDYNYADMFSDVYSKRIKGERRGKDIFLSICMPSLNRGETALRNIRHLAELMYDEEIEIILCNNSSTKGLEYYKEIEELAKKDVRIVYREMESTCFADSFENVLSLASGRYALFNGDEDFLLLENIGHILQCIHSNRELGVLCFEAISNTGAIYYRADEPVIVKDGYQRVVMGIGSNYMSGLCFNMGLVRERDLRNKIIERYHSNNENSYYISYAHCVFSAFLAYENGIMFSGIPTFKDSAVDDREAYINGEYRLTYTFPEARCRNLDFQTQVFLDLNMDSDELIQCILGIYKDVYRLLRIAYGYYMAEMSERHEWSDTCRIVRDSELKMLDDPKLKNQIDENIIIQMVAYVNKWYEEEFVKQPVAFEK